MTPLTRPRLAAPLAALALLTPALLTPALTVRAQGAPGRASTPGGSDLSPAQKVRAQARQAQFQKDVAALQADKGLTDTQKRARYATMLQAMDKDMLAILTPAQRALVTSQRQIGAQFQKDVAALQADKTLTTAQKQARYQALRQAANQRALATLPPAQRALAEKQQRAAAARQADVTRMGKELQASLTTAQQNKIHEIALASGTQIQALITDKSVSEETKPAKIAAMRAQAQTKINAVLTPSQRAVYSRIQSLVSAPMPQ